MSSPKNESPWWKRLYSSPLFSILSASALSLFISFVTVNSQLKQAGMDVERDFYEISQQRIDFEKGLHEELRNSIERLFPEAGPTQKERQRKLMFHLEHLIVSHRTKQFQEITREKHRLDGRSVLETVCELVWGRNDSDSESFSPTAKLVRLEILPLLSLFTENADLLASEAKAERERAGNGASQEGFTSTWVDFADNSFDPIVRLTAAMALAKLEADESPSETITLNRLFSLRLLAGAAKEEAKTVTTDDEDTVRLQEAAKLTKKLLTQILETNSTLMSGAQAQGTVPEQFYAKPHNTFWGNFRDRSYRTCGECLCPQFENAYKSVDDTMEHLMANIGKATDASDDWLEARRELHKILDQYHCNRPASQHNVGQYGDQRVKELLKQLESDTSSIRRAARDRLADIAEDSKEEIMEALKAQKNKGTKLYTWRVVYGILVAANKHLRDKGNNEESIFTKKSDFDPLLWCLSLPSPDLQAQVIPLLEAGCDGVTDNVNGAWDAFMNSDDSYASDFRKRMVEQGLDLDQNGKKGCAILKELNDSGKFEKMFK